MTARFLTLISQLYIKEVGEKNAPKKVDCSFELSGQSLLVSGFIGIESINSFSLSLVLQ